MKAMKGAAEMEAMKAISAMKVLAEWKVKAAAEMNAMIPGMKAKIRAEAKVKRSKECYGFCKAKRLVCCWCLGVRKPMMKAMKAMKA